MCCFVKSLTVAFLLHCPFLSFGQDYRIYHQLINNAERCYFLQGNTDSAFFYYDKAFAAYSFVFARDCYLAAQIACYHKNEKCTPYLRKCFEMGIDRQQLLLSPVLAPVAKDSTAFRKRFKEYGALRKKYLARIDAALLADMIRLTCKDQTDKRMPVADYAPRLLQTTNHLAGVMRRYGYPGEKLIGLSQNTIMAELGQPQKEVHNYTWGRTLQDEYMSIDQGWTTILYIHMRCPFHKFTAMWGNFIGRGEVHPQNVAIYYDAIFHTFFLPDKRDRDNMTQLFECGGFERPNGWYMMNKMSKDVVPAPYYNRHKVDSMRSTLYLPSIALDSAKRAVGKIQGFKTSFGHYWFADEMAR